MPIKPKLLLILVHYAALFGGYVECRNRRSFQGIMRRHPFALLRTVWILYRLRKRRVLQFELRHGKLSHWYVRHMNKPVFGFTCHHSKLLMKTFEEHLEQWLEKQTFIRTKPPAGKKPE